MAVGPDQGMRSSGNNSDGNCNSNSGGLKKGPWTPAEDAILLEYVRKHGEGNWNAVQKNSGLSRCGKSCRLRWANHLRPNLKKGAFSPEEELLILRLHAQLGNKWARMAAHLPGRTDNEIKNYWNTRIKRRQRAGLPLYPTDIQRQAAAAAALNHNHHPSATTQPPLSPASPTTGPYSAQPLSLLDPFGFSSRPSYHLPLKRLREDNNNLSFHLGFSSAPPPPLYQPPPTHPFQYNPMGFTVNGSSAFAVKMELASTQMFGGEPAASGGGGLLDAMLQETAEERDDGLLPEGSGEQDMKWVQLVTGEGEDGGEPPPEPGDKCDDSEPPSAKKMKRDDEQPDNHHVNEDLSALLDMIPATVMPAAATIRMSDQWCNSESGRMSHGPLSVITDEEMKLDMQQLAEGQHWNIGPCPWSPAGIC